ncbi:serine/threonine-protein kinase [Mycobacterium riyadhense]|uniref:serine/threonine-protein kinase n=1 Tax=Mycobacterium riyadhense TaxID=486698 RepID=UPI00195EFDB0|nr:serine/threonine-protein kinase [Mycobacterium riyadhense]
MALSVGTVVAGYTIEGVLGAGGMGTVYLARHPTLPRADALKILSAELSLDEQFRVRFTREADLAATLTHPNIVTVFNRGETDDGQLWIAMQYIEGTAASDLPAGTLTTHRVIGIIGDVAAALDHAHSGRVLHRDIKPSNFLVAHPGVANQERTLLADFGIARALDDSTTVTATGSLVGTASYAPPEAIEGGPLDHRADIYSLGCSLFRLLTGRTPYEEFRGAAPAAMLMAHVLQPIPRPSQINPNLPPGIDDVIAHAMAKNPADRYPSAGALAAAATAALAGHSPSQPAPSGSETRNWTTPPLPYPTTPPPGRGNAPIPPAAPLNATLAPHPTLGGHPGGTPAGAYPADASRRKRRRKLAIIASALTLVTALTVATVVAVLVTGHKRASLPPYQPQTLSGKYGTVELRHRPLAVAALGPGDPDAVLSLGVQPVAIGGIQGKLPSWLQSMQHSSATLLPITDPIALAAAKPDLIIDTGDIDKPTYDQLAATAPTLTRPADTTQEWNWQNQLTWIAQALGRSETAKTLLNDSTAQQTKIKSGHPAFSGKSITVVNLSDTATTAAARVSAPTSYLEGIGFAYNTHFQRGPNQPPDTAIDRSSLAWLKATTTDVMILNRTDHAAGSGGFAGLPREFSTYTGILIIIDDPATITALNTGGPAATSHLNTTLVTKLANQIH